MKKKKLYCQDFYPVSKEQFQKRNQAFIQRNYLKKEKKIPSRKNTLLHKILEILSFSSMKTIHLATMHMKSFWWSVLIAAPWEDPVSIKLLLFCTNHGLGVSAFTSQDWLVWVFWQVYTAADKHLTCQIQELWEKHIEIILDFQYHKKSRIIGKTKLNSVLHQQTLQATQWASKTTQPKYGSGEQSRHL